MRKSSPGYWSIHRQVRRSKRLMKPSPRFWSIQTGNKSKLLANFEKKISFAYYGNTLNYEQNMESGDKKEAL